MRTLVFVIACFCSSYAFSQIEISETKMQSIVGAVQPRIVGDRILVSADSKPKASVVSIINVASPEPVLRIVARKTLEEDVELERLDDASYLIATSGRFRVEVNTANHFRSIWVVVDATPVDPVDPKPPVPNPVPPPVPPPEPPKPDVSVPNEHGLGKISYVNAPKKDPDCFVVAQWYKRGAGQLYGEENVPLLSILAVLDGISAQMQNKPCKSKESCEQWAKWKVAISAALIEEQKKTPPGFSREKWYRVLNEISASLELAGK
jgi:hypothetical protein